MTELEIIEVFKTETVNHTTTVVTCPACKAKLCLILETEVKDIDSKHVLVCPCGQESYTIKTHNRTSLLLAEGFYIENIETVKGSRFLESRYILKNVK